MPEPGRERWSSVSKGMGVDKDEKHPGNIGPPSLSTEQLESQ